ncbi:MAG TPA: hypothetical protein VGG45_10340 [Terracidiphilus sp.]|jgi:hypothetical protein
MENATVFLSIKEGGKGIPYGGTGEDRPDGSRNHGFKPLKSNPEEIAAIPEAQGIAALTRALVVLNGADSPFLTVGCEKAVNKNDSGHWVSGYLEFAFNYGEMIADAAFYFKLFFLFNQWYAQQQKATGVQFHFELQGAIFLNANMSGYTVTTWILGGTCPSKKGAMAAWEGALDMLVTFLSQHPKPPDGHYTKIY